MVDFRVHNERKKALIEDLIEQNYIFDAQIENAFRKVPMEKFLPSHLQKYSYYDTPLPFYKERPMAAPHINAIFLQLLQFEGGESYEILQLSSMGGYFAALMAEVSQSPIKIVEGDPEVVMITRKNLKRAGYSDLIEIVEMDPIEAFWKFPTSNRIIFCGAVSNSIIEEISRAMPNNSILIAPVFAGLFNPLLGQDMIRVTKSAQEEIHMESFGKVSFILIQSESFQKKASETQRLIFKQIEQSLEEYFTTTLPREEPLLNLNLPEHILNDYFAANTLYKKEFKKAAILLAILAVKESINYVRKVPLDFTKSSLPAFQSELRATLNEHQWRNFETLLDIEESIVNFDHRNPPNLDNLAKMALDITSDFLEQQFKETNRK
ncbi:MAG: hypothetical protein ACTSRS_08575 [Candidatus Helarchaeota archaeon]